MLWKVLGRGSDVCGVGYGVRIVDDNVVKVSGDVFEAFDDLVNYLEPAGGGSAALRHDNSLEKPVRCAEDGEGKYLLADGNLVKGGDEVEQDLVDAGEGELSEGIDGVQLLITYDDAGVSILLGE